MAQPPEMLCETWNLTSAPLSHSRLYCLEPIGLGTALVECLTSYVNRLAEAHSVSPYALLVRECAPVIHPGYFADGKPLHCFFNNNRWAQIATTLNSMNTMTQAWVMVLQQQTTNATLSTLTMLPWRSVLSTRGLLRRTHAWCPQCYAEWLSRGQVVYTPLLWMVQAVRVCTTHRRYLRERCDCGHTHLAVSARSQSSYCPRCQRWLGNTDNDADKVYDQTEWQTQEWIVNMVGQMLTAQTTQDGILPLQSLPSVREHIRTIAGPNAQAILARNLEVEPCMIHRWLTRSKSMTLSTLLKLAAATQQTPLALLTANTTSCLQPLLAMQHLPSLDRPGRKKRTFELEYLRAALEGYLQAEAPFSMDEVARQMDIAATILRQHFPDLCRAISARYQAQRSEAGKRRLEKICHEVRQAVYELHAEGLFPTNPRVTAKIGRSVLLERPVYEVYLQCRRELGYA